PPQPRRDRGALAARGRQGDAAGTRRPVRRIGRADPSNRKQGAENDARPTRRIVSAAPSATPTRRPRAGVLFPWREQRATRAVGPRSACVLLRTARETDVELLELAIKMGPFQTCTFGDAAHIALL